jgi:GDP-4-dehydro-6-deoxy-D-mannose reductase
VTSGVPTVLVTGASGFAGSHLLEHLSGSGDLTGWSRSAPTQELSPLARWTRVDMLDRERVRQEILALRPTVVYHCAGAAHVGSSWQDTALPMASNVLSTHYLLDALRLAGTPCRVVITGSANVYAASTTPLAENSPIGPASPYAVSKLAQEQLGVRALVEDGVGVVVARAFNHIGARQSPTFVVAGMARQIAQIERDGAEPVIRVGNLDTHRDLTDVRDTVRAYAMLMERGVPGAIYNVSSGVGRQMRAVLDALIARSCVVVEVVLDQARLRPNDLPVLIGDATRLRMETGWEPRISFNRTLDDILDYWRSAERA